jgi:hypothetical protein
MTLLNLWCLSTLPVLPWALWAGWIRTWEVLSPPPPRLQPPKRPKLVLVASR